MFLLILLLLSMYGDGVFKIVDLFSFFYWGFIILLLLMFGLLLVL